MSFNEHECHTNRPRAEFIVHSHFAQLLSNKAHEGKNNNISFLIKAV